MLVSCAAYQDGTKLGDITIAQIPEYLHRPKCFVWVALHDPAPAELTELQKAARNGCTIDIMPDGRVYFTRVAVA